MSFLYVSVQLVFIYSKFDLGTFNFLKDVIPHNKPDFGEKAEEKSPTGTVVKMTPLHPVGRWFKRVNRRKLKCEREGKKKR